MHACLGARSPKLVPLRDVLQVAAEGDVDWDVLSRWAREWHLAAVLQHAFATASATLAAPVPSEAGTSSLPRRPNETPARFRAYTGERRDQGGTAIATLRAIPGVRGKAAYALALVLPDREFLTARVGTGGFAHLRRWRVPMRWAKVRIAERQGAGVGMNAEAPPARRRARAAGSRSQVDRTAVSAPGPAPLDRRRDRRLPRPGAGLAEAGVLALIALIATTMSTATGSAGRRASDRSSFTGGTSELLLVAGVLAVVRLLLQVVVVRLPARLSGEVQSQLRDQLFGSFLAASWSEKAKEKEGHLQELMGGQSSQAGNAVLQLAGGFSAGLMFLTLAVSAFLLSAGVAAAVMATAAVLFAALRPLSRRVRRWSAATSAASIAQASGVAESVRMAEEVRGLRCRRGRAVEDRLARRVAPRSTSCAPAR